MSTTIEQVARVLWERFAPTHNLDFDEDVNRSEYLRAAEAVIATMDADDPVVVGRYVYRRIDALMGTKPGTPEAAELDMLSGVAIAAMEDSGG